MGLVSGSKEPLEKETNPMNAVVTPTSKSSAKPFYVAAAVLVAALVVVIALAVSAWATGDGGQSKPPIRSTNAAECRLTGPC